MNKKIIKIGLLAVVLIVLLGWGGYKGYRSYQRLQQRLLVKQARDFLAKPDLKNASLCLNRAIRYNPNDLDACRLMAELAERVSAPDALSWRKKVVEIDPNSLEDRLLLVNTALKARDIASAKKALEGVDQAGKNTAGYHNEAGAVDVASRQIAQAEAQFLEASRLEPTNMLPLLNIAVLRLGQTNAAELEQGRSFLRNLSINPTNALLRRKALIELVADARRYRQTNSALALTKTLVQETNSFFEDKILRLEVLSDARDPEYKPTLEAVKREAAGEPAKIYVLAAWENKRTPPAELLAWLKSLPATTQTNRVVAMLMAEAYSNAKDWRGMQTFLQTQKWAELEFLRSAMQARALDGQKLTDKAKAKWAEAVAGAGDHKQNQVMLLELAGKWQWSTEMENLLRDILAKHPNEQWAFQQLAQDYFATGRTWPLLELMGHASESAPSDFALKNNLAWVALLVNAQAWKPYELAREVYQKSPTNSHYVSTYALSLHLQHKDAEALKVLQKLNPAELESPSMAGGYGLVLDATGNKAKAKKYLELASKSPMLPEQRKMIEQASTGP